MFSFSSPLDLSIGLYAVGAFVFQALPRVVHFAASML